MINKNQTVFFISLLFLCATLMSCQSSNTPLQVSEHFWLGMQTKNVALVKKYSLVNSIEESEDLARFEKIAGATFGKIIIDGNTAEIETKVMMSSNEKNNEISLNTYLENNNEVWKVNYRKTALQLIVNQNMAEAFDDIDKITAEITEQLEESVEKIKEKVLPEIQSRAEEIKEKVLPEIESKIEQTEKEVLKKLPELKTLFDEFLKELQKSLEELIPEQKEEEVKTQET